MLNSVQYFLEENPIDYHVALKTIPARRVMSLRRVIPDASYEGPLWSEMFEEAQKQNIQFAEPMLGISIYPDKEYQEEAIDLELQNSIAGDYHNTETIKFFDTPAVEVASVIFHGPYDQMPQVMTAIGQWLEIHDYEINGPMFNINHISPAQDSEPNNWITEACLAVQKLTR